MIQRQKELNAKSRGKVFTIHAKLIALAAQRGSDPSKNSHLADAITAAKKDNVPADNIERAVRRGAGLDKDAAQIEEIYYEGYAPGGVAIVAKALTDNRNRTAPNVRHAFSKYGGSLGETGSVSHFAFRHKGVVALAVPPELTEAFEEAVMSADAEDYSFSDGSARVVCDPKNLATVAASLKAAGFPAESAQFEYLSNAEVGLDDFDKAFKVHRLISELEEDDDIETVWHNAAIADDMAGRIEEALESSRFRT